MSVTVPSESGAARIIGHAASHVLLLLWCVKKFCRRIRSYHAGRMKLTASLLQTHPRIHPIDLETTRTAALQLDLRLELR